jgi:hypothetical protein
MRNMKNRLLMICGLLALTSMVTFAAAIDGKWTVTTEGRNGPQTQTLTLKADGGKLTGSLDGGRGPADIMEGKIDGNNVSFKMVRAGRDGANQTTTYTGTLAGDDLKLSQVRDPAGKAALPDLAFKRAK